jgi:hypothetical protein
LPVLRASRSIEVRPAKWNEEEHHLEKRKSRHTSAAVPFYVAHPEDSTRIYVSLGGMAHPLDLRVDREGRNATTGTAEREMVLSLGTPLLLVGEVRRLTHRPHALAVDENYELVSLPDDLTDASHTPEQVRSQEQAQPETQRSEEEGDDEQDAAALFSVSKPEYRPYYLEVGEVSFEQFLADMRKDKVDRARLTGWLLLGGASLAAGTAYFYHCIEGSMVSSSLLV